MGAEFDDILKRESFSTELRKFLMCNTVGLAAGCPPHLKPRQAGPELQVGGRFVATLGPLLPGKVLGRLPQHTEVALLTVPPNPEGLGYVEFDGAGYQRQTLWLGPSGTSGTDANVSEIKFDLVEATSVCVTHIAVIAANGQALYSSRLTRLVRDRNNARTLWFAPYDLKVKQPWNQVLKR